MHSGMGTGVIFFLIFDRSNCQISGKEINQKKLITIKKAMPNSVIVSTKSGCLSINFFGGKKIITLAAD